ncbi:cytochrome P450 [Streptomyces lincolnensis]|uniref:cytochrome P450 n=1 Tax=Streptomyces lincolnensis TaxID=1915 RepID=UPI001E3F9780|nr:cytochrome P450 [Streptomyces lincolnensis]MCD7438233.1 cytochrome P450 [Streptomyces lincolnensis]
MTTSAAASGPSPLSRPSAAAGASAAAPPAAFNPLDLSHSDDPYPRLAALRRERPVSTPLPGWHVVVRDAEVRAVLADPALWSSRRNNTSVPDTPEADRELALSQLDPPAHTRLRRLLSPAFARAVMAELEPVVRQRAEALADRLEPDTDLVDAFAAPLPRSVLAAFCGVEEADAADYDRWAGAFTDLLGQRAHAEWPAFERWALRAADGPVLSGVLGGLDRTEAVTFLHFLIVAGVPNLRHALGNLVLRLLCEDHWRAEGLPEAIEESLRLDPPALWQMRTATRDTTVAGTPVRAGERVVAVVASANRDAARWGADADAFRPDRPGVRAHLAFGKGPHACLGASLTRLQLRVAAEVLIDRYPRTRLAPDFRFRRAGDFMSRGPAALPVHLERLL